MKYIIPILLLVLSGCADIPEEHGDNSVNEISQTKYSYQTLPNKYSVKIPDNLNSNLRSSSRTSFTNSDFINVVLTKYSQLLIEEDRYMFSKDFEITNEHIQKDKCIDQNVSITVEVSDADKLLDRMINFAEDNKFSDVQVSSDIKIYESLKGSPLTLDIKPSLYQELNNDSLYDHVVMSNYEENISFCNSIDDMVYNDQIVWRKNENEERLAGFGANMKSVKGLYYDKNLKTGSYFYIGENEEDYLGNEIEWNRMIQKSGHFSSCGDNCVIFQSSGFFDNVTLYELKGIFDSDIGGYINYKISSNGNVSEGEEYLDTNNNIISKSSKDNWNSLTDKLGLDHTLNLSNLNGSNKVWLLFNTNTLPSNGRLNWWNVEGVVTSDNNSNFFSSLVRVSDSSGTTTLYAHEISSMIDYNTNILAPDSISNTTVVVNSN